MKEPSRHPFAHALGNHGISDLMSSSRGLSRRADVELESRAHGFFGLIHCSVAIRKEPVSGPNITAVACPMLPDEKRLEADLMAIHLHVEGRRCIDSKLHITSCVGGRGRFVEGNAAKKVQGCLPASPRWHQGIPLSPAPMQGPSEGGNSVTATQNTFPPEP